MSINLDEWKDYERSLELVKTAQRYALEGSWFGLSKNPRSLVVKGVEMRIKCGSIVPEDVDYIKSIVGLNDSAQDIH